MPRWLLRCALEANRLAHHRFDGSAERGGGVRLDARASEQLADRALA
jgi:hypothetical protein